MNKGKFLFISVFALVLVSCNKDYSFPYVDKTKVISAIDNMNEKPALLVNLDGDHWNYYLNDLAKKEDLSEADLRQIVHWYTNSDITDLLFNILDQSSNTKTDVMSFRGDMYTDGVEGSAPVDYSFFEWNYRIMKEMNIDVFELWFDECRANNIHPWLSLRMNDRHESGEETSIFRGDLFYQAKANGWMLGDDYGGYATCFNYEVQEIRDVFLGYIEEQLLQYDVDGIELDFIREIYCFDYLHKAPSYLCSIMNDFMREVHIARNKAETKWGHPVKVSARLPRDLEQAYAYGFDAATWHNEKLVDSITVTAREICDSAMPLAYWKERLPNISINAGLESKVCNYHPGRQTTPEMVNGYASQYLTAGAAGIYLFNYYKMSETSPRSDEIFHSFATIGEVLDSKRRHIVSNQDLVPQGYEPYQPLPLKLDYLKEYKMNIETGLIPEGRKISVIIGLNRDIVKQFSLSINNVTLSQKGNSSKGDPIIEAPFTEKDTIYYLFEGENVECATNVQVLSFKSHHMLPITIEFVEIDVSN